MSQKTQIHMQGCSFYNVSWNWWSSKI